jgi:hypothetical protein
MFEAAKVECAPLETLDPTAFHWSKQLIGSLAMGVAAKSEEDV